MHLCQAEHTPNPALRNVAENMALVSAETGRRSSPQMDCLPRGRAGSGKAGRKAAKTGQVNSQTTVLAFQSKALTQHAPRRQTKVSGFWDTPNVSEIKSLSSAEIYANCFRLMSDINSFYGQVTCKST